MKTSNIIISLVFLVVTTLPLMSQTSNQTTGKWLGTLVVNESIKLRLGIEFKENEQAEFVSVIHSLDQGAFDIPIKSTLVSADSIILNIEVMGAIYKGRYVDDLHIEGIFFTRK